MSEKQFNPAQPRDPDGKWSGGGSSLSPSDAASAVEKHLGIKPKFKHATVLSADEFDKKFGSPDDAIHGGVAAIRTIDGAIWIKEGFESDVVHEMVHSAGMGESGVTTFMNEGVTQAAAEFVAKESGLFIRKTYADEVSFVNEHVIPATGMSRKDFFSGYASASNKAKFISDAIWAVNADKFSDRDDWGATPRQSLEREVATAIGPGSYLSYLSSAKQFSSTGAEVDPMILVHSEGRTDMDPNLILARDSDIARRADLAFCYDLIVPLKGVSTSLEDRAFFQATKSYDTFVVDGKTMTVESVVSDESKPDRSKEVVLLDGLNWDAFKGAPLGCFLHNRNAPVSLYQDPATKACTLTRVGKQLRGREYFVQKGPFAELAEQVFQLHENGLLRGKSIGFIARWDDYKRIPDDPGLPYGPATTRIEKSSLFEISSVFVPDNERSLVTEVVRKGLGSKSLHPALFNMLAPFADQSQVWNGWTPPPAQPYDSQQQGAKSMSDTNTGLKDGFEKCGAKDCGKAYHKYDGDEGHCPACAVRGLKGKIAEMASSVNEAASAVKQANDLKARADRADWYEKAIGKDLTIGTDQYPDDKPTGKVLRAIHDSAMFAAASALCSIKGYEGPAERALLDFAASQENIAAKALREYQLQFSDADTEWSTVKSLDVYEGHAEAGSPESVKSMVVRVTEWAIRFKGWGRGQTVRCQDAAEAMRSLADKSDSGLNEEARKTLREQAKSLETMADANGKFLSVSDRKTDEIIKQLTERVEAAEKATELAKKKLKNAERGQLAYR